MTRVASRTIRFAVQNLIGGVSQQPNSVRNENQCERQDDAIADVVDGLGKRQPTEHINCWNTDGVSFDPAFQWPKTRDEKPWVFWMNISPTERYVVLVDQTFTQKVHVWNAITGLPEVVTGLGGAPGITADSLAYIGFPGTGAQQDPNEVLEASTIGDRTYILNKTQVVAMTDDVIDGVTVTTGSPERILSKSARRWFLFLRSANFSARYTIRLNFLYGPNYTVPALRDTWAPLFADDLTNITWVKTYNGDVTTRHTGTRTNTGTGPAVPTVGYGQVDDLPPYDPAATFHEGYQIGTANLSEIVKALWFTIAEPPDVLQAVNNYITRYPGGIVQTNADAGVVLRDTTVGSVRVIPQVGSVIKLELDVVGDTHVNYREDMRIQVVEQGDSSSSLLAFSNRVARINQLPLQCEHGQIVKITGEDEETTEGAYHVKFVVDDFGFEPTTYPADNLGQGHWEESSASLQQTELDANTMPHSLQRVPDAMQTSGFRFELGPVDWADRLAGDDDTNPPPSFVGTTIQDIFLHRNRLGVLTGSRILFTEADKFDNFWRTTVQQLLDSDPIDLNAGHTEQANLNYGAALEHNLFLFADENQFVVEGGPLFTPRTASVSATTKYDAISDLRPLPSERGIFFAYQTDNKSFSQIRQLSRVPGSSTQDAFSGFEVTGQIPRYLKGKAVEMTASSLASVLAVRTDDTNGEHIIYIYKWLDRGADRLLSSWMRFRLGADSTTTKVLGMHFFDDDLYLIMQRENTVTAEIQFHVERMTFSGQRSVDDEVSGASDVATGDSMAFRCLLDRRLTQNDVAVTYDATNLTTDLELDFQLQTDSSGNLLGTKIVTRLETDTGPAGEQLVFTHTTSGSGATAKSTLHVEDEDKSLFNSLAADTARFFIGQDYTMEYEFSRPTLRETTRSGSVQDIKTGRLQLLRGHLSLEDTGFCEMKVAPALHSDGTETTDKDTRTYIHPLVKVGLGDTFLGSVNVRDEVLRFPIKSQPKEVRLIIENNSPYPCNPKSLEIEAIYSRRSAVYRG